MEMSTTVPIFYKAGMGSIPHSLFTLIVPGKIKVDLADFDLKLWKN
jgi:hypothetical protein